jgi:hypothetical protein
MQIDRDLRIKLQAAADAALHRALERAGNRLRARARGNTTAAAKVDGVPGPLVAPPSAGPSSPPSTPTTRDLLREAFERFRGQWTEWTAAAAEDAIDTAARSPAGTGTTWRSPAPSPPSATPSRTGGRRLARPGGHLTELATGLMYEPNPAVDPLGELPDAMVPPGMIRAALAAVGGSAIRPPRGHLREPCSPVSRPGQLLSAFIRDAGAEPVEYEWAYGISSRPFKPHEALDGQVFSDFNAPELCSPPRTSADAVDRGSLAPGDHKGCHCDYALIWADGNSRDEQEIVGRTSYPSRSPARPSPAGTPPWTASSTPPAPDPPSGAEETP